MIVIKRDSKESPVDIKEIRDALVWACQDLPIEPLELESHITAIYDRDIISTKDIQMSLIGEALQLTSVERPEYRIVAARLLLMELYKEAAHHRGYDSFGYSDYLTFVRDAVKKGYYDERIFSHYSEQEIYEAGRFITPDHDLSFDYGGVHLLAKRYLIEDRGTTFELPQEMFLTIALLLAANEDRSKRLDIAKEFYHAIASRKISLATPILINLRRVNGNLSSCFIAAADDSLDSIFYSVNTIAQISKNGGGVGINLSRIRASGSEIKGVMGASGGVIPWIRIMNDTAVAVNQLGKRAGAVTTALDIWHRDVLDFLELQTENGDQRKKAYDIFPQLVICDIFMKRVEENREWTLFDPHEVKLKYNIVLAEMWGAEFEESYLMLEGDDSLTLSRKTSAKDLFKRIMRSQIETGMPYLFFKDTVNSANPNKHDGMIGSGNLCQESYSNFRPSKLSQPKLMDGGTITSEVDSGLVHTCNLVSLNLAVIKESELSETCSLAVRMLDNTIDFTTAPIKESESHNLRYRTIGVGAMGLADLLAKKRVLFEDSADFVDKLFEEIAYFTLGASVELSAERGPYPLFRESDWDRGIFFGRDMRWFKNHSSLGEKWSSLYERMSEVGIRNSQLLAIAPNTSSSLLQGCSAGVMPVYSKFHIDKSANGAIPICPPFIKECFWYYKENKHIDQQKLVEVISRIQKWVDQGISMELLYNLNSNIRAKDIYDTLFSAWKRGVKAVYYTRTIQKNSNIGERADAECISCTN